MNEQLIQANKAKMLAEVERIKAVLSNAGTKDGDGEFPGEYKPNFPELGSEEGDNASEVEQYATNLAVTQDMETKLASLEAALQRIENGTYGKCPQGDDIEEDRLAILPDAQTCMKHSS